MATKAPTKSRANLLRELGFIREEEYAQLLRVEVPTLRNRASAGNTAPRYKLGSESVYKIVEVKADIERRRVELA